MNSTPSANHPVDEVVTQVVEEYPIELAVLFGSYARGTETPESDIDVAVAFDGDRSPQKRLELRIDLVVELTKALEMDAVDVADFESIRLDTRATRGKRSVTVSDEDEARILQSTFRNR